MARSEPSLALQKAIRARLLANEKVCWFFALPDGTDNIVDASGRPELVPSVNIGESQTIYRRFDCTSYATLHVWFQEPGLIRCKAAVSAIVAALTVDPQIDGVLALDGFTCLELAITQTRFMRDPHGSYSHGIVSVAGILKEKQCAPAT